MLEGFISRLEPRVLAIELGRVLLATVLLVLLFFLTWLQYYYGAFVFLRKSVHPERGGLPRPQDSSLFLSERVFHWQLFSLTLSLSHSHSHSYFHCTCCFS